jgi:hypothetical protein
MTWLAAGGIEAVPAHRGQDHVGWPAGTGESRARVQRESAAARATGVPRAPVGVKAISFGRRSLTA